MKTIDLTPTWATTALIYAEAYANHENPRRNDQLKSLVALGKSVDFIASLKLNDDGSLTLGSEDVKKYRGIVREED